MSSGSESSSSEFGSDGAFGSDDDALFEEMSRVIAEREERRLREFAEFSEMAAAGGGPLHAWWGGDGPFFMSMPNDMIATIFRYVYVADPSTLMKSIPCVSVRLSVFSVVYAAIAIAVALTGTSSIGHWPLIPLQPNHRLLETGTPERFGRLLAYHNDSADRGGGVPVDTLFDAFLFSGDGWYGGKNIL